MNDEVDLEAIRERERKATKGPFVQFRHKDGGFTDDLYDLLPACKLGHIFENANYADCCFYQEARQDIPDLLALVDEAVPFMGMLDKLLSRELIIHESEVIVRQIKAWLRKAGK
jgi:hypothetical protein